MALGDTIGDVHFYEYDLSKIASLTDKAQHALRFNHSARELKVSSTTVDAFCKLWKVDFIDILKIDVEACDLLVVEGARGMLEARAIRFISVEFNDLQAKEGSAGGGLSPIDSVIRPYGYRFIASYTDYVETSGELYAVSNALFALPVRTPLP